MATTNPQLDDHRHHSTSQLNLIRKNIIYRSTTAITSLRFLFITTNTVHENPPSGCWLSCNSPIKCKINGTATVEIVTAFDNAWWVWTLHHIVPQLNIADGEAIKSRFSTFKWWWSALKIKAVENHFASWWKVFNIYKIYNNNNDGMRVALLVRH